MTAILISKLRAMVKNRLRPLYNYLQKWFAQEGLYQNINYNPLCKQKRALISYITYPFNHSYEERIGHTSNIEIAVIVKTFIDMDCVVDVIHCENNTDINKIAAKKYDYIFGFGKPWAVAAEKNPHSCKVMYLTECAPMFSAEQEQLRLDYYAQRHRKRLPLVRSNKHFLDEHIKKANIGAFFGNMYTAETYIHQFPLMKLNLLSPSGFRNIKMNICPPPGDACSFLWFGSWGAIHKGLDILLDVFRDIPEAKLYIAGLRDGEKWILNDYKRCDNIINLGFLDVQSIEFLKLTEKIPYCILPSASEGMSTSVLTCMRHGMIPVITPACGIDVADYGYLIEDYHIEAVTQKVQELMQVPKTERQRRRQAAYDDANEKYSLEAFSCGMQEFIKSLVAI